jgi:hypothetical protein
MTCEVNDLQSSYTCLVICIRKWPVIYDCYISWPKSVTYFRNIRFFIFLCATVPLGPESPHYRDFTFAPMNTLTLAKTTLDEWSARRRDLSLTAQNTHKRQTTMALAGFEIAVPPGERLQAQAVNEIGKSTSLLRHNVPFTVNSLWFYFTLSLYLTPFTVHYVTFPVFNFATWPKPVLCYVVL